MKIKKRVMIDNTYFGWYEAAVHQHRSKENLEPALRKPLLFIYDTINALIIAIRDENAIDYK